MSFEKDIQRLEAEKKILKRDVERYEKELDEVEQEKKAAEEARQVFQFAARKTQEKLETHFSVLVTKAFELVLDDPYEFVPKFEERRNKTECDLWVKKDGVKRKPKYSTGGGVIDVASFTLRLAYNRLEKSAPILILDEPFKMLSPSLIPRAIELLHLLSEEFGIQMIISTHISEIAEQADKVFEIENGKLIGVQQNDRKNFENRRN